MDNFLKLTKRFKLKTILLMVLFCAGNSSAQNGWFEQNSGVTSNLSGVEFVNSLTGWIVGQYGRILYTTDGGNTWQIQNSHDTINLLHVQFVNENTGWALGTHFNFNPIYSNYVELMIKTTNGGLNWNTLDRNHWGGFEVCLKVIDQNEIFRGYYGYDLTGFQLSGALLYSSNGGSNWVNAISKGFATYGFGVTDISFINDQTGWAFARYSDDILNLSSLIKTTDGGQSWDIVRSDSTFEPPYGKKINFINELTGYSIQNHLNKTTDGGYTWAVLTQINSIKDYTFINPDTGWVIRYPNQIFRTTDGGQSWQMQSVSTSNTLNKIYFLNQNTGWIIGQNGTVLKTVTGGLTNVVTTTTEMPNEFNLHQNFPNPFNPVTKIRFDIPQQVNDNVKLVVYDMLGKEVAMLINQQLQPGSYEYTFDANRLSGGVYFYVLSSGSFFESKKMVILK